MSGNHKTTESFEKDFLINHLHLKQYKNTTVFTKDDIFILSPSISINKQNKYWFDMREININRFDTNKYLKFIILIRIVDVGIVLLDFEEVKKIMNTASKKEQKGLKVWSFTIEFEDKSVKIFNKKDKTFLSTTMISKEQIKILLDDN